MRSDPAMLVDLMAHLYPARPVVIAGPTASGKSALALAIACEQGRTVVNADALQVFSCWRILTARPGAEDLARAPHALYGHLPHDAAYSVGDWLRDVADNLDADPAPVIVGGTGLYLSALTEGLADIPPTDPAMRTLSEARLANHGVDAMAAELDPATATGIDRRNPRRVQRAWEVLRQTGRGLAAWQADAPPPLVSPAGAHLLHLKADKAWLTPRIAARFDRMLADGAMDEVAAMASAWNPALQSARAIGAAELMAAHRGERTESEAIAAAKIATVQYAKRQRTWFRRRMQPWRAIDAALFSREKQQHSAATR